MKRHVPGLHREPRSNGDCDLGGLFLVRVDRAFYRWHPQKPFFVLRLVILEPNRAPGRSFSGRLYCTPKALWKLSWFLRDFGYDTDLLGRDEVDEKALRGLARNRPDLPTPSLNGRSLSQPRRIRSCQPIGKNSPRSVVDMTQQEARP